METKPSNKIKPEITVTLTKVLNLKPFGQFRIMNQARKTNSNPRHLDMFTLRMYNDSLVKLTKDDYNTLQRMMVKYKTDIFIDGTDFYTTSNDNIIKVEHDKIRAYVIEHCKRDNFLGTYIPKEQELANPKDY